MILVLEQNNIKQDIRESILKIIGFIARNDFYALLGLIMKNDRKYNFNLSFFAVFRYMRLQVQFLSSQFFAPENLHFIKLKISNAIHKLGLFLKSKDDISSAIFVKTILDFFLFLLLKCSEVIFLFDTMILTSLLSTFEKTFWVLNFSQKSTMIIQFCVIVKYYSSLSPKISNFFKKLLITIYCRSFFDTNLRTSIAYQLIDLYKNAFDLNLFELIAFYSNQFFRSSNIVEFCQADLDLFALVLENLDENGQHLSDIIIFMEKLNVKQPYLFFCLKNNYCYLVNRFWRNNEKHHKKFNTMWCSFFNKLSEISVKIIMGQRDENHDIIKMDLIWNIKILKNIFDLDVIFFKNRFDDLLKKLEKSLDEIEEKTKKSFDLNIYIRNVFEIFGYKYFKKIIEDVIIQKKEEIEKFKEFYEIGSLKNIYKNTRDSPDMKKNTSFTNRSVFNGENIRKANTKVGILENINSIDILEEDFEGRFSDDQIVENKKMNQTKSSEQNKRNKVDLYEKFLKTHMIKLNQVQEEKKINDQLKKLALEKLQKTIQLRLKLNGRNLTVKSSQNRTYDELLQHFDVGFNIYFPFNYQKTALSTFEKKAIFHNFNLHKNFFRSQFRTYAQKINVEQMDINNVVNNDFKFHINPKSFFNCLKNLNQNLVKNLKMQDLHQIFLLLKNKEESCLKDKFELESERFCDLLSQFSYRRFLNEQSKSVFECFEFFFDLIKKNLQLKHLFENDYLLNAEADKDLISHFQKIININPDFLLPLNFEKVEIVEYKTEKSDISESIQIARLVIHDIMMMTFEMNFNCPFLSKKTKFVIRQKMSIYEDFNFECKKCYPNDQNKDISKLNNNDLIYNTMHHSLGPKHSHKISTLSLNLKLEILSNNKNCKKDLFFVAEILESVLKRVDVFTDQRPFEVAFKNNNLKINKNQQNIEIFNQQKNNIQIQSLSKKTEKPKSVKKHLFYLPNKIKSVRKMENVDQSKDSKNIELQNRQLVEKMNRMRLQKIEIAEHRQAIEQKKQEEAKIIALNEREKNQKRIDEYKKFQQKELQKLTEYFKKKQVVKEINDQSINRKKDFQKKSSKKILDIKKFFERQNLEKKALLSFKKSLTSKLLETNGIKKRFKHYKIQSIFLERCQKLENGEFLTKTWTLKEFLKFSKDYYLYKNVFALDQLKYIFENIREIMSSDKVFNLQCFEYFIVFSGVSLIEEQDENFDRSPKGIEIYLEGVEKILGKCLKSIEKENASKNTSKNASLSRKVEKNEDELMKVKSSGHIEKSDYAEKTNNELIKVKSNQNVDISTYSEKNDFEYEDGKNSSILYQNNEYEDS